LALEQEVKLAYPDVESARTAILAAGGQLVVPRRLLDDLLFDTADGALRRGGSALRLRADGPAWRLTWKGPVRPGSVKAREELETAVEDGAVMLALLQALGYRQLFRGQKYREEYALGAAVVTVDDTPAGVYVEIEGSPEEIDRVTTLLGRTPADYRLESYPTLWRRFCEARGTTERDMIFEADARRSGH
jgi:adenylate cyclase class 2